MKIIDEKGRLFGIINVIDLVLLLLIAAIAVGIGYKYVAGDGNLFKTKAPETKDYLVTFFCPRSPAQAASLLKVGDRLFYDSYGELDAVVESVDATAAAAIPSEFETDRYFPDMRDITVVVRVSSSAADKRIMMAGIQLNIGKELLFKTYRVEIPAYIIDIRE